MKRPTLVTLTLIALTLIALLAACTSDQPDAQSPTVTADEPQPTTTPRSGLPSAGFRAQPDDLIWTRVPDDIEDGVFGPIGGGHQQAYGVVATDSGFVAVGVDAPSVGQRAAVWASDDGAHWRRIPHDGEVFGGDAVMLDVAVGGPGLVAVGLRPTPADGSSDAAIWTSGDGTTWARVTDPSGVLGGAGSQQIESVISGGPGLVAVGTDQTNGAIWTSPDGLTWTRVSDADAALGGNGEQRIVDIAAGAGGLVAIGVDFAPDGDEIAVWLSPDGLTWERIPSTDPLAAETGQSALGVAAGGPGLVMVGAAEYRGSVVAAVWTSADGLDWARIPHDESLFGGDAESAMTAVAAWDGGLVAVGQDNAFDGSPDAAAWFSVDGVTWTQAPYAFEVFSGLSPPFDQQLMLDVAVGGELIVGVGVEGPFSEARAAAWAAGTANALGRAGLSLPETDSEADEPALSPANGWRRIELTSEIERASWFGGVLVNDVVAGGPGLIAVGAEFIGEGLARAAVWTSEDGSDWVRVPHDDAMFRGSGADVMNAVTTGGPGFVAVGTQSAEDPFDANDGGNAVAWTSPDGLAWTRIAGAREVFGGSGVQSLRDVAPGGPGLVAVGSDGFDAAIWVSEDGTTWRRIDGPDFGRDLAAVTTLGDDIVVVGQRDDDTPAVWTSADGFDWRPVGLPPSDEAGGFGPFSEWMTDVTTGRNGFIATGTTFRSAVIWTSRDGLTWQRIPQAGDLLQRGLDLVATDGSRFAAAGIAEEGDYSMQILLSGDGATWEQVPVDDRIFGSPEFSFQLAGGIAFSPQGAVVIAGSSIGTSRATGVIWIGPPADE